MAWLDFLKTKSSAVLETVVSAVGPGRPIYTPRDFAALAREGYNNNVYVYRAILTIAQAASAVPWKLFREGRKLTEVPQHPLLDLMKRPNPEDGGSSFWKKVIVYQYLAGNSYIESITAGTRGMTPMELWTLRPDRMSVVPDARTRVGGYLYEVFGSKTRLDAANVLHWKMFNPVDDWYGISPIAVASRVVDQMNAANDWNTALLQNSARPPGAMQATGKLTTDQRKTLREDLTRMYQGPRNAGRMMILDGGLTWIPMGVTPKDLDWLAGKVVNAREIAIAIGVAPELLGDSANKTYSNMMEARKALYSEAVLPLLHELRDHLNNWLVPMFDDTLALDIDTSGIEALAEDVQVKRAFAVQGWQTGLLMLNEARKMIDLEEVADGEIFFVPNTGQLVPEENLIPDEDEEDTGPLPPMMPVPGQPILITDPTNQPPENGPTTDPASTNTEKTLAARWMRKRNKSREEKAMYWHNFESKRAAWYGEVSKHVAAQFSEVQDTLTALLKSSNDVHVFQQRMPFALSSFHSDWQILYKAIYLHVGRKFAASTYKSLVKFSKKSAADDTDYEYDDPILDYLDTYGGSKIQGITDTTQRQVQDQLLIGVNLGESIDDLAARIDTLFLDQIIPNRSSVIAQTEVIAASNLGSRSGALATGLDLEHQWLATNGPRTRTTHADADGQSVALDEPFSVGGSDLMFPGDNSLGADAGEIINCRCTEIYNVL